MIRSAFGRRFVLVIVSSLSFGAVVVQALTPPAHAYPRPGRLERLDVSTDGRSVRGSCGHDSSVGANRRFVAFDTDAPLVDGDTNQEVDVYLRDLRRGTTELISLTPSRLPAVGPPDEPGCLGYSLSWDPSITPDGRYIAFASLAFNLVDGDTNGLADIFVYDRRKRTMERVSVSSKGRQASAASRIGGHSTRPSISADGRYVSFSSSAGNLVANDTNDSEDVFVHDRRSGETRRVSVSSQGRQSDPCPRGPNGIPNYTCYLTFGDLPSSISLNGRYVAFHSRAPDLVSDDTNGIYDVFVHDLKTRRTERISIASDKTESQDLQGNRATGNSGWSGSTISGWAGWNAARVISANGRYVAFVSTATNLVPNDANRHGAGTAYVFAGGGDAFVHDRKTGRTERVSVASDGREQNRAPETGSAHVENPAISADGRYVSFKCSGGCELTWRENDSAVVVFDRKTGAPVHAPITKHGDAAYPGLPDLSPSGRYVSFAPHYWYDDGPLPGTGSGVAFYLYDRGRALGIGGLGRRRESREGPGGDPNCVTPETCISPNLFLSKSDPRDDASNELSAPEGADIIEARVAYRPQFGDLYLRLDVSEMPAVRGTAVVGDPLTIYGFRIEIEDAMYEFRAARTGVGSGLQPAFGLFRCDGGICTEVARLVGGYGTTSDNIVAALPLNLLGLQNGDRISRLAAFTGHGTYLAGDLTILDKVELR